MNGSRQRFHPEPRTPRPRQAGGPAPAAACLLGLLLALALQLLPLGSPPAWALSLPWQTAGPRPVETPRGPGGRGGLQEVPPPPAVQQLQAALADREPVVEILAPQNDALLGAGSWTLKLRVRDWPLVDAGELGLGPHLVVQLDQEPPRIWTSTEGQLPELSPGSHRLTVYAALPWGEARRNPGAVRQIRLHRTAPNPLSLPEPGSPQLLAVSPPAVAGEEPLLFDALLLDAPLQNVGGAGTQWRLRVGINGDDVLIDEQTPLWLRGWKAGVNALTLELLDARGTPLNPPFNSLVREVNRISPPPRQRWRGDALSEEELAVLTGRIPVPPAAVPPASPPRDDNAAAVLPTAGSNGSSASISGEAAANRADVAAGPAQPAKPFPSSASKAAGPEPGAGREPPLPQSASAAPALPPAGTASGAISQPVSGEQPRPAGAPSDAQASQALPAPARLSAPSAPESRPAESPPDQSRVASPPPELPPPAAEVASPSPATEPERKDADSPATAPGAADPTADAAVQPQDDREIPADASTPLDAGSMKPALSSLSGEARLAPGTSLSGRARDLVNDDGTLRRPERRGPLAALREKLQG